MSESSSPVSRENSCKRKGKASLPQLSKKSASESPLASDSKNHFKERKMKKSLSPLRVNSKSSDSKHNSKERKKNVSSPILISSSSSSSSSCSSDEDRKLNVPPSPLIINSLSPQNTDDFPISTKDVTDDDLNFSNYNKWKSKINASLPQPTHDSSFLQHLDVSVVSARNVMDNVLNNSINHDKSKRKRQFPLSPEVVNSTNLQNSDGSLRLGQPVMGNSLRNSSFPENNMANNQTPSFIKYKCQRCGMICKSKNSYKSHKKRHNKLLRESGLFEEIRQVPEKNHNPMPKYDRTVIDKILGASLATYPYYKCKFCLRTFHFKKITPHLKFQHGFQNGSKNYNCFNGNENFVQNDSPNKGNELQSTTEKDLLSSSFEDKMCKKSVFERLGMDVCNKVDDSNDLAVSPEREKDLMELKILNFIKSIRNQVEAEERELIQ